MYFFRFLLFSGTARANRALKQDVTSEPPSVEASVLKETTLTLEKRNQKYIIFYEQCIYVSWKRRMKLYNKRVIFSNDNNKKKEMLSKHQKYFFLVSDFWLLIFDIQNSRETRSKKSGLWKRCYMGTGKLLALSYGLLFQTANLTEQELITWSEHLPFAHANIQQFVMVCTLIDHRNDIKIV